jgi:hypothetical protein
MRWGQAYATENSNPKCWMTTNLLKDVLPFHIKGNIEEKCIQGFGWKT